MASPMSPSSDYSVARRLQEEYLANFEKHREQERLSALAAAKLERELKHEREEAMKQSELLAKKLDHEYREEEWRRNQELELDPDVVARAMFDSPLVTQRAQSRTSLPVGSPDAFLVLQSLSEDSPDWLRFQSPHQSSPLSHFSHVVPSPISYSDLSTPLPRSYTSRRSRRVSPVVLSRAVRQRMGAEPDIDNMSYEELQRLCERNGDVKDKAASSSAVSRLPTAEVKSCKKGPQDNKESEEDNCCSICLEPFKKKQVVKTLPCFHRFHVKEIDKWLKQSNSCPICKQPIDP